MIIYIQHAIVRGRQVHKLGCGLAHNDIERMKNGSPVFVNTGKLLRSVYQRVNFMLAFAYLDPKGPSQPMVMHKIESLWPKVDVITLLDHTTLPTLERGSSIYRELDRDFPDLVGLTLAIYAGESNQSLEEQLVRAGLFSEDTVITGYALSNKPDNPN